MDLGWPHLSVARQLRSRKALELLLTCGLHTGANRGGALTLPLIGQLLIIDAWNLHMNIDAVEQRATDALLIASDGGGRTGTFAHTIRIIATRAGIHRGNQHTVRRVG